MDNSRKLLMVVNNDWFFLSHRKDIALKAREDGWDVTVIAHDTGKGEAIRNLGLKYINLPIDSTGMNPVHEMRTLIFLTKLYRKNRDAVVHHVGLKNIVWGGIAARWAGVHGVVNAVSGLGSLFSDESSMLSKGLLKLMKWGQHRSNVRVIFQNHDDEALFDKFKVMRPECKRFIKGSGIDLKDFCYRPEPRQGKLKVIFTGRMIVEKGVFFLIEAANKLRDKYSDRVEFWLVGDLYPHPKAIKREQLEGLCDGTYIKWLGHRNDVKELLAQSAIVAFPSFYREGLPKSLIEANAVGRPIITTDSIGCRDTVEDGVNGFLIPPKDSDALAMRISELIDNPQLREKMGLAARRIAERDFSIDNVVAKHLEIYNELNATGA